MDSDETIEDGPGTDEVSDTINRLLRGGSFAHPSSSVRSAYRNGNLPVTRIIYNGFRPARTYNLSP